VSRERKSISSWFKRSLKYDREAREKKGKKKKKKNKKKKRKRSPLRDILYPTDDSCKQQAKLHTSFVY
jgi:hypothetical protein